MCQLRGLSGYRLEFVLDAKGERWVVVAIANHDNANRAQGAPMRYADD